MRPIRQTSKRPDGYKSGLEAKHAKQIEEATGLVASDVYESMTIEYTKPARVHRYKPDWPLWGGRLIIESKGIFDAEDREKHLLVKAQRPELDIRFCFTNAQAPIYPRSPTTMAAWCEKHGFKWAHKIIPISWLKERAT